MIQIVKTWLAKPSGRYFDGLAIFTQLASTEIKKRYEAFFNEVKVEPKQHDYHFTMLINKVSDIARNMRINPKGFENIHLIMKQAEINPVDAELIAAKEKEIQDLKNEVDELTSDNEDKEDENSELTERVEILENSIEQSEKELIELKSKRGIQIIAFGDMPENLQNLYNRNREITPVMASLHGQISVEKLHFKTRAKLVAELCKLDDERRANWDVINDWSEGKEVEIKPEPVAYSEIPVIAGAQMERRILKLRENIKNSNDTVNKSDKETIKQNALKRIAAYEKELAELQEKLLPAETEGSVVE